MTSNIKLSKPYLRKALEREQLYSLSNELKAALFSFFHLLSINTLCPI